MKNVLLPIFTIVFFWLIPTCGRGGGESKSPLVKVELTVVDKKTGSNRQRYLVANIKMGKGWHTYWVNPGDAGMSPRFKWKTPDNVMVGEMLYPVPERIMELETVTFGYRDSALFVAPLECGSCEKGVIGMQADLLVCDGMCVPVRCSASVDLSVIKAALSGPMAASAVPVNDSVLGSLPAEDPSMRAEFDSGPFWVRLRFSHGDKSLSPKVFKAIYPLERGLFDLGKLPSVEREGDVLIVLINRARPLIGLPDTVTGVLEFGVKRKSYLFRAVYGKRLSKGGDS